MTEEWQSQKFRQTVIAKINELTQSPSMDPTKNANVMENHIFKRARSREEYLGLVAKLFMHLREMNNRPGPGQPSQQQNTNEISNNNIMQDPINALQNLASQGSRNNQIMTMGNQGNQMPSNSIIGGNVAASNLLQTLTQQQRPGPQIQNMQGIRGQMNITMGSNMPQNNIGTPNINMGSTSNMGPQMSNNMGPNINAPMNISATNSMANQGPPQIANCLPGQINQLNQIPSGQIQLGGGNMQGQPMSGPINNVPQMAINSMNQGQMNISMNHPQLNQMMGRMNANPAVNVVPPNVSQSQLTNTINVNGPGNMNNLNTQQPQMNQQSVSNTNTVVAAMGQNTNQINPTGAGINQIIQIQQQKQMINQQKALPSMPPQQQQPQSLQQQQQPPNVVSTVGNIFQANRNAIGQNQFLRQSPSPQTSAVPSPVSLANQQQQLQNAQMIPSPALVPSPSPQMSNMIVNNQRNLRQSPSAPLNTPGQVTASSPFNAQEDQLYREKYKQLTKYIEPLKRMVAKIGNDDVEKITKMNKLLEILCNPHQRIPLDTLLKCEKALEKMDFKSCLFVPSSSQFGTGNPLLEAVNATLQSPIANHTLQRTFRPCLEALFGTDIRSIPYNSRETVMMDENISNTEIPHVLQGEIARLDQKFKVSLDSSSQMNNKIIKLLCCLDDKRLPCVPPVSVNIPEEYPLVSPSCSLTEYEYSSTPFLIAVQNALISRITKLPKLFSLSHLLDVWEMSVRQACSPNSIGSCELMSMKI